MDTLPQGVRLSRADRKEHILHEMRNSSTTWQTVHTLSRLIKMEPSTHIRNMLAELVEEGRLHQQVFWGDWTTCNQASPLSRWYCLPERDPRKEMFG